MQYEIGYYDFEGNTLYYEGGCEVYDIDSAEYLPTEVLIFADYLGLEIY